MHIKTHAIAAIVMAVLIVTVAPASAATTNVETVATHTSGSDFENATLTNMSVSGSGDSASVVARTGSTITNITNTSSTGGTETFVLDDYTKVTTQPSITLTGVVNTNDEFKQWDSITDSIIDPEASGTGLADQTVTITGQGGETTIDSGRDAYVASSGDFDSDGNAEIAFRDTSNDDLTIYDPIDDTHTDTGEAASAVSAGDTDSDGTPEILFRSLSTSNLIIYDPVDDTKTDTNIEIYASAAGDLDSDGTSEIALRTFTESDLLIYDPDSESTTDTGESAYDIDTGDTDNDGRDEIVYNDGADNLKIYDTYDSAATDTNYDAADLTVGDTDGDSGTPYIYEEIIFTDASTNELKIYDVNGDELVQTGNTGTDLSNGDTDGDGNMEAVYADGSNEVSIYDPGGGTTSTTTQTAAGFTLADNFDGDGVADIAFRDSADDSLKITNYAISSEGTLDIGDNGTTDLSFSVGAESETYNITALSPGEVIDVTSDNPVDLNVSFTERTATQDPSVELNGVEKTYSGTLNESETTTIAWDDSTLQPDADNTLNVTLTQLSSDAPIMEVDYNFSTATYSTWTTAQYASPNVTATNVTGATAEIALQNASATVSLQQATDSGWSTVASTTTSTNGSVTLDPTTIAGDATFRVVAEFEATGSEPYAEVLSDTVRALNHQPNVDASDRTTHNENVTVTATLDDPQFSDVQSESLNATLYWQGSEVKTLSGVTSSQEISYSVSALDDGSYDWAVRAEDDGGLVTWRNQTLTVDHRTPDISGLSPDQTQVNQHDVTLQASIEDGDFGKTDESVAVSWYLNGNQVATDTITSNSTLSQTVSTPEYGSYTYRVEATDSFERSTDRSSSFETPYLLQVYNESAPTELIDYATVEIRFYDDEEDTSTVYERTTSNGTIDMTGLPATDGFTASAEADGYLDRRSYVPTLFEQKSMYMLPENKSAYYQVFVLNDMSGQYPPGSTRIQIERALDTNGSGTLTWTPIAGDYFGAINEFSTELRADQRYRLWVVSQDGDRRQIGAYIASDSANPKEILIRDVAIEIPDGDQYSAEAWVSDNTLRFAYRDPSDATDSLSLRIYERGNATNELFETTVSDLSGNYTFSRSLSGSDANTTWLVEWSAQRGSESVDGAIPVGSSGSVNVPIAGAWLQRFALLAIPIVAALASERIATYGALGAVAFAGMLIAFGWLEINIMLWFAAATIAIGGHAWVISQRGGTVG